MECPVIAPDGHSYDLEPLLNWLKCSNTSPITRQLFDAHRPLLPNHQLRSQINALRNERRRIPEFFDATLVSGVVGGSQHAVRGNSFVCTALTLLQTDASSSGCKGGIDLSCYPEPLRRVVESIAGRWAQEDFVVNLARGFDDGASDDGCMDITMEVLGAVFAVHCVTFRDAESVRGWAFSDAPDAKVKKEFAVSAIRETVLNQAQESSATKRASPDGTDSSSKRQKLGDGASNANATKAPSKERERLRREKAAIAEALAQYDNAKVYCSVANVKTIAHLIIDGSSRQWIQVLFESETMGIMKFLNTAGDKSKQGAQRIKFLEGNEKDKTLSEVILRIKRSV